MRSLLVLGILGASLVYAQDTPGLKARELFYTSPPQAAPAPPPKAANNKKMPAKRTTLPAAAPAAASSVHTVAAVPLGVRYSVLKRNAANQFVEVDPDTTFHSGDRIRIQVQANTTGYLYVVTQGSSGTWQVLFPSAEVAGGSNLLEPGDTRQVPAGDRGQFLFDDRGGTEKLFLVLARQAEPDFDKLIYSMGGTTPGGTVPGSPQTPRALQTSASVSNDVVERVRGQVSARDLVIEKVDGEVDGKVEKAAYVVNPSTSADARLVVDVALKHQ